MNSKDSSDKQSPELKTANSDQEINKHHDSADLAPESTFFADNALLEQASYKKLEEDLNAAESLARENQRKAEENLEKALRVQAEFDNYRRRSERDLDSARKFSIQRLIEDLLPIIDSLESAMAVPLPKEGAEAVRKMHQGIELTLKLVASTLQKFSVQAIDPLGKMFDPTLHEAVSIQETDAAEPGTILVVLQKGYTLYERSIRPARVIVAKSPVTKEEVEDEWMD